MALALATAALFAGAAHAADPLAPRLPWDEGGWSAREWIGLGLELCLFLVAAALVLRLGRPPAEE